MNTTNTTNATNFPHIFNPPARQLHPSYEPTVEDGYTASRVLNVALSAHLPADPADRADNRRFLEAVMYSLISGGLDIDRHPADDWLISPRERWEVQTRFAAYVEAQKWSVGYSGDSDSIPVDDIDEDNPDAICDERGVEANIRRNGTAYGWTPTITRAVSHVSKEIRERTGFSGVIEAKMAPLLRRWYFTVSPHAWDIG